MGRTHNYRFGAFKYFGKNRVITKTITLTKLKSQNGKRLLMKNVFCEADHANKVDPKTEKKLEKKLKKRPNIANEPFSNSKRKNRNNAQQTLLFCMGHP